MENQFEYFDINEILKSVSPSRGWLGYILIACTRTSRMKNNLSSFEDCVEKYSKNQKMSFKKIEMWLQENKYIIIYTGLDDILAIKDFNNKCILSLLHFTHRTSIISMACYGDIDEIKLSMKWFDSSFEHLGTEVGIASRLDSHGDVVFNNIHLIKDHINLACQSFYPWLNVGLEQYFNEFMKSDESTLVLFGPPGTGKSTFIRSLIISGNYKSYLAYDKAVIESPQLLNDFYEGAALILAYEDVDNYLHSREDGNRLMSSILNASEGIIKNKDKKLIFSTNLPSIDRIDSALLRKGRCFDILEFRELTPIEAEAAAHDVGADQKDWSSRKSWSLAHALSSKSPSQQTINRFARKVGFHQK